MTDKCTCGGIRGLERKWCSYCANEIAEVMDGVYEPHVINRAQPVRTIFGNERERLNIDDVIPEGWPWA